jgi:hypothetical protein
VGSRGSECSIGGRRLLDAVWRKGRQESLLQFLRAGVGTYVKKEGARFCVYVTLFVDGVKSKAAMNFRVARLGWLCVSGSAMVEVAI